MAFSKRRSILLGSPRRSTGRTRPHEARIEGDERSGGYHPADDPRGRRRAAERFGDLEGARRRRRAPHVRRARRRGRRGRPGPHRLRRRARRPRRDLGAEHRRVGHRRARRATRAAAVVVPLNTRFKGGEAATCSATPGPRCCSPSPTSSTPTTSPCSRGATGSDVARGDRRAPRPGARGRVGVGRLPRPRRRIDRRDRRRRAPTRSRPDDLCDILFTSGTTGRPKGAMLTHGASIRAYDAWSTSSACATGDRYLIVNPFFHAFGLKAGHPRLPHQGRDDRAAPGVRRAHGDAARRRGAHLDAARPAGRSTRRSSTTPTSTTSTCRRCASRSPARPRSRSR